MLRLCLIAILFGAGLGSASAEDSIWGALVLATNEKEPAAPPTELAPFAKSMRNVFGYNQFEVIGSHTQKVEDPDGSWLIPSKRFCLRVKIRKSGQGQHLLTLLLYQEQKLLVGTRARLGDRSPLFIRGPLYGPGQLIIVLSVK
jgi:hypothetical protein